MSEPKLVAGRAGLGDEIAALLPSAVEDRLRRAHAYLLPLLNAWMPVARLTGTTRAGNRAAQVIVAGDPRWTRYLPDRLFAGEPRRDDLGHAPVWRLPRVLASLRDSADFTLARIDRISARLLFGGDHLIVPEWIGMRVPLPLDLDALARRSNSVAEDRRKLRRGGWTVDVVEGDADFDLFYDRMFVPHTLRRYGGDAYIRSRRALHRDVRNGAILWLRQDGRAVAGALFVPIGRVLMLQALGVEDGDAGLQQRGVMGALYLSVIDHAQRLGCAEIDLRGVRASLTDGLLRYKRKWGGTLYDKGDVPYAWALSWSRFDGAVAELLGESPVVFRDGAGHSGMASIAAPPRTADEWDRLRHALWTPGLRRLCVVAEGPATDAPPPGIVLIDRAAVAAGGPRALLGALRAAGG